MKHKIKYLQFYIGNVCNMACPNCASYNNYAFTNQFDWGTNETAANAWSNILDPYEVAIIGGEPFTNPDIDNWVHGLLKVFKPDDFRITTNGSFLERDINKILEYTSKGVNIEISSHSDEHFNQHNAFIKEYFPTVEKIDDYFKYTNANKGFVEVRDATRFFNISIKETRDGIFYMHDSDAGVSHSNCPVSDCHYIVEGRLYQCVVTAAAPLFVEQFNIDVISKELIQRVKSISPFDDQKDIDKFLNDINNPCEQCSLCPERITVTKFLLPSKKEKI